MASRRCGTSSRLHTANKLAMEESPGSPEKCEPCSCLHSLPDSFRVTESLLRRRSAPSDRLPLLDHKDQEPLAPRDRRYLTRLSIAAWAVSEAPRWQF